MPSRPASKSSASSSAPLSAPPGLINAGPSVQASPQGKRPADGVVDGGDSSLGHGGKMKLPRLDQDFSSVVKTKLQSYTRTGQACDRCKVRKIRCDALPGGCSHCVNGNIKCYVTDRVTGRTERRGYMNDLEQGKNNMMNHIRDLEKLLEGKGIEVKPFVDSTDEGPDSPQKDSSPNPANEGFTKVGSLWIKETSPAVGGSSMAVVQNGSSSNASVGKPFYYPNFPRSQLQSRPDDTRLGVGWDSRPLSSINGTRLTIMGATIDTASFDAPDVDEPPPASNGAGPLYNKSVQAFLQSAMGVNPPVHADLPARNDAFTYAEWYFLVMSSYIPVLHKPSFMKLLTRIYDEPDFKPTAAELVMVHMVFAIIYYQYGIRNWQEVERRNQLNDFSNRHYHYSLSKFFELMSSRDLPAVQAMVLIASHTRAFPKPGCSTIISALAFQRALELNLHRAPKMPPTGTNLTIEMRKRTWWVLLMVYVAVTGRRGRPMPITVEEFDVGFPEAVDDDLLSENGVDKSRPGICRFVVGLATFKMIPILMEMYSNLYSVRRDAQNYVNVVNALERQLKQWEDDLPEALRMDHPDKHYDLAPLYTKMFSLELRLWLRHNSVNPLEDKAIMAENSKICEDTARELLRIVQQIIKLKSLDATWTQASIYAMSLFSMLVAHWERRFETTREEVAVLRQEMDDWMAVLKELSLLMGSGPEIRNEIAAIVDRTIAWIEHDMANKELKPTSAPPSAPVVRLKSEQPQQGQQAISHIPPQPSPMVTAPPTAADVSQQHAGASRNYYQNSNLDSHAQYPNMGYGNQAVAMQAQGYNTDAAAMYYPSTPQNAAAVAAAAAVVSGGEAHSNPLVAFASQGPQSVNPNENMMWQRGGNTWQDWTAAIADTQDRYGVGALMSMGGASTTGPAPRGSVQSLADGTQATQAHDMAAVQWPLTLFDQSGIPSHEQQHAQMHQTHAHHHHGTSGA